MLDHLQIVVLAGGTNDFHAAAPPLEEWIDDIINFIDMVGALPLAFVTQPQADPKGPATMQVSL